MFSAVMDAFKRRFDRSPRPTRLRMQEIGERNYRLLPSRLEDLWPAWVHQTCLPTSPHFIATDLTGLLLNTQYRRWTRLGSPGLNTGAIVDSHGLITPLSRHWSLDTWIAIEGNVVGTSQLTPMAQTLDPTTGILTTQWTADGWTLTTTGQIVIADNGQPVLCITFSVQNHRAQPMSLTLVPAIRPCTPEGVGIIHQIHYLSGHAFVIDHALSMVLDTPPDNIVCLSDMDSPAYRHVGNWEMILSATCPNALATAFVEYRWTLAPGSRQETTVRIPLDTGQQKRLPSPVDVAALRTFDLANATPLAAQQWTALLKKATPPHTTNPQWVALYQTSLHYLLGILERSSMTEGALRDMTETAWVLTALIRAGYATLVEPVLTQLLNPEKPLASHVRNQEGQWLWILQTFLSQCPDQEAVWKPVMFALAKHIRTTDDGHLAHAWWRLAGLKWGIGAAPDEKASRVLEDRYTTLEKRTWEQWDHYFEVRPDEPARLIGNFITPRDSTLIDALVVVWPLDLFSKNDNRIANTVSYIRRHFMTDQGLFQPLPPSGFSPSLQALLAIVTGERTDLEPLLNGVSSTGVWPDAIHPVTGSGCGMTGHDYAVNALFVHAMLARSWT